MLVNIFLFWLFLIPFAIWSGYYEGPKIFLFLLGGAALSVFWIVGLLEKPHLLRFEKKDFWFWLWLAALTISSLIGVHPQISILGGSYRYQGVVFFLALWLTGKTIGLLDKNKKRLLYKSVAIGVIAESLIVFYQLIFGKFYLGHPLGTLGEPNAVAGFLAIGTYFVFISFPKVAVLIPPIALLLTKSRAGILALLPDFGILVEPLSKKAKTFILVVACLFTGASVFYLSLGKIDPNTKTFEDRQVIWPMALQQIVKRPFLGYGAESGEVVFNNSFRASGIWLQDLIIDRAHNLFLDVAMWSGGIGLVAFSFWLYFSFIDLKDTGRKLAFLSFLIYSFFQPLSVVHWVLLIIVLTS